jgi:hypothetical protein
LDAISKSEFLGPQLLDALGRSVEVGLEFLHLSLVLGEGFLTGGSLSQARQKRQRHEGADGRDAERARW